MGGPSHIQIGAPVNGTEATGGVWDRFPQPGDKVLYELRPIVVRFDEPSLAPAASPVATQAG